MNLQDLKEEEKEKENGENRKKNNFLKFSLILTKKKKTPATGNILSFFHITYLGLCDWP